MYIQRIEHVAVKKWSLVHFVAAITVDTLITAGTALHLYKKKTGIQSLVYLALPLHLLTNQLQDDGDD